MYVFRHPFLLLFAFVVGTCLGLDYEGGVYILFSHKDSKGSDVALPDGQFELMVEPTDDDEKWLFSFKYGNLLTSYAILLPTGLAFTALASTKMMPPSDVYQLEQDLEAILESATRLSISKTDLTITGETGSMSYRPLTLEAEGTPSPKTPSPDADAAETSAPETDAPETDAPETDAPETDAPETDAPETDAPETLAPETSAPERKRRLRHH
jgi:hypothetical protein